MKGTRLFNDGWQFSKRPLGTNLVEVKERDAQWEDVEIPHDWLIYDTHNLYETGEGWYRKSFDIQEVDSKAEFIALRFEGVYMDATLYVNGEKVGEWKYGYSTFEFEITDFLVSGVNEVMVQVVYQSPNSRWYSGAGIYRNVWLKRKQKNRIVSDGVYVTPRKLDEENWRVEIDTELMLKEGQPFTLRHTLLTTENESLTKTQSIIINETDQQAMTINHPRLWGIGAPNLYLLKTELLMGSEVIDWTETRFGFREFIMDPQKGFFLNGEYVKIFGACQHHDLGCLGAAVNKAAIRRQFELLQEMGVNALRTAHNMPAVEFMEVADEMGLLVCTEAFDMWESPKTTYDYARFFKDWAEKDVASWVRRDRNHPSVIMWSIGNEIYDTHGGERGQELTVYLKELVEKHDPKGHAPVTIGSNYMPWENAQKCADIVKVAGYNYAERCYEAHHERHPDWIIYGSETSSTVQSRGIYRFPLSQSVLADDDEQCSALGNSSTSWGAKSTEACIEDDLKATFSLGQFIWTGFDYIGEPTPYHTKNSYFGQLDTAGFKKDSFYIYQAAWTNYKTHPMIHVFPYWDFSKGQLIDVRVCTNAPTYELFFNDTSLGTSSPWQIPYETGTLRAVAYDEQGNIIAEDKCSSFKDAEKIVMKPNKTTLTADGQDLLFIELSVVDKFGVEVANATNRLEVEVTGAGRLVGLDNGDSTDYDSYKGTSRRLFSGKLLAVIAATHEAGALTITVRSSQLKTQTLTLNAVSGHVPVGASKTLQSNTPSLPNTEIPIRKIDLIKVSEDEVQAKIYPENATYDDLQWRVTDKAGIDSNIATIVTKGDRVKITTLGDGDFYLRCMTKNGRLKTNLISQLGFTVTGKGQAFLNPYGFIAGGVSDASNVELTNGNERGIATLRDMESHVGFRNVDFGPVGADTVTLPIFPLEPNEFPIEIWEGMPGDGEKICTVTYDLGSKWNTYQEATYELPRKLKGVTTLCFVFRQKVHLKGFSFARPTQISAKDYSYLYGDTFTVTEDAIEGIGNNVSIGFDDLALAGVKKISICGKTPLKQNTIRLEIGERTQLLEFKQALEYDVQEFELEPVVGNPSLTFIFLPGCQFDFKGFKFSY